MNAKSAALHEEAIRITHTYLDGESSVIDVLEKIYSTHSYRDYNQENIRNYAAKYLKLSEDVTETMIRIIRRSFEVPELKAAFRSREIDISKARRLCSVITVSNQAEWIERARSMSVSELNQAIARLQPDRGIIERKICRGANRLEIRFGISYALDIKMERARDLLSQKNGVAATYESMMTVIVEQFLEANDPLLKALKKKQKDEAKADALPQGLEVDATASDASVTERDYNKKSTSQFSAATVRAIHLRDEMQCTHIEADGKRCKARRWLHIHHRVPRSRGGGNELENLTTLCSDHHLLLHHRDDSFSLDGA